MISLRNHPAGAVGTHYQGAESLGDATGHRNVRHIRRGSQAAFPGVFPHVSPEPPPAAEVRNALRDRALVKQGLTREQVLRLGGG